MNWLDTVLNLLLPLLSAAVTWFASRWWFKRELKRSKDCLLCNSITEYFSEEQLKFLREWDHGAIFQKQFAYAAHDLTEKLYQQKALMVVHDKKLFHKHGIFFDALRHYSNMLATHTSPSSNPDYLTMDVNEYEVSKEKMSQVKELNDSASMVHKAYVDLITYCKKELYL
jgi:hypothetical protein